MYRFISKASDPVFQGSLKFSKKQKKELKAGEKLLFQLVLNLQY